MNDKPRYDVSQEWSCAKCNTRNPHDVTKCLYCGTTRQSEAIPYRDIPLPMPIASRLLLSLLVAIIVFILACYSAYTHFQQFQSPQQSTLRDIAKVVHAITTYQQQYHHLPETLKEVSPDYREGRPMDWWRRPLQYKIDGIHYKIISFGRDGKPGGVGYNYDLSSDDIDKHRKVEDYWPKPPPQARPNFPQFVTDPGEKNTFHGSGSTMFLSTIYTGIMTFLFAFFVIGSKQIRRSIGSILMSLLIITATSLLIGFALAMLELPSSH